MSMPPFPARNPHSPLASLAADHVAIRVPELEAAARWFVEKLDFRVVHRWRYGDLQLAYVAPADDDGVMVELIGGATSIARPRHADLGASLAEPGFHHLCLRAARIDDTIAELRRRGVTIVAEPFDLADISRRLAFIADPWGNLIEFAQVID